MNFLIDPFSTCNFFCELWSRHSIMFLDPLPSFNPPPSMVINERSLMWAKITDFQQVWMAYLWGTSLKCECASVFAITNEFESRCLISARDSTFQKFIADGIFATLHVLGCFSMILTGPVLDKFGPSVVHCLSLVVTVSGHAVLWQLTMHHDTEALPYILYVAAYIAGKAFCYFQMIKIWSALFLYFPLLFERWGIFLRGGF